MDNVRTYPQTDSFDLQKGMAVYEADGRLVGAVRAITGFGPIQIDKNSKEGSLDHVTEARTGTGHFSVDRREVVGAGANDLIVPFHGIESVTPGHGVTLSEAAITVMRGHMSAADSSPVLSERTQRKPWFAWRPRRRR